MYKRLQCYRCRWYSKGLSEYISDYDIEMCVRPRDNRQVYILTPARRKLRCEYYRERRDIILYRIKEFTRKLYIEKKIFYDTFYIEYIINLARIISSPEIDIKLLTYAAYFYNLLDNDNLIRRFLEDLGFEPSYIKKILDTAKEAVTDEPMSLEAMVLHDAIILNNLGALGIAINFLLGGYKRLSIDDIIDAVRRNLGRRVFTERAREIIEERIRYTRRFLKTLNRELNLVR